MSDDRPYRSRDEAPAAGEAGALRRLGTIPCQLGWHKPIAPGLWNAGYCFTSCSRCGRDMVRSLFGEWHVPENFRVVWNAATPSQIAVAPPVPEIATTPVPPVMTIAAEPEPKPAEEAISMEAIDTASPTETLERAPVIETTEEEAPAPEPAPAAAQPQESRVRSPFDFDDFD